MTDYYVDPAATGSGTGADWTNAFTTLAAGYAAVSAGDTIFGRGTEILSSAIAITTAGDTTSGRVKFFGCNSSGVIDGTTYKISGALTITNGITCAVDYQWIENLEIFSCTNNGIDWAIGGNFCVFYNVISRTNGANGWGSSGTNNFYLFCRAEQNTADGWTGPAGNNYWFGCVATGNGNYGWLSINQPQLWVECISHDNGAGATEAGFRLDRASFLYHCIADAEINGIVSNDLSNFIVGCRMTNNSNGYVNNAAGDNCQIGFNLFHSNTADISDSGVDLIKMRNYATADSNKYDPDSDDGYTNRVLNEFNLKRNRTYNGDGNDTILLGIG